MAKLKVGTWPWLLRHEMRLQWRGIGGARLWLVALFGGVLYAALHLAEWAMLRGLDMVTLPPITVVIGGAITWLVITLMLSQAIMLSVSALFDRGDLDLLLSSPLSPRTVFTVRGLGIAVGCTALYFGLVSPFANMGILLGKVNLLAIYPAMISMGLLVTAIGLLITLALVRLIGARRARVAAQLLGALIGAVMFLGTQVQSMFGQETRNQIAMWLKNAIGPNELLAPDSFIWFPFRAFLGNPISLLSFTFVGVGAFLLVTNLAHQRFLSGTQESVTGSGTKSNTSRTTAAHFSGGKNSLTHAVLIKEWKLIWRDPQLLAQTFLQILYLMPLVFVVFRKNTDLSLIVPSTIFLASSLAGSLAWITVAAEDAPELIGCAPVNITQVRWLKTLAALIPVWVLISPIFIFLCTNNLSWALIFLVCVGASTIGAGVSHIWYPRSGDRKNMKHRAKGSVLVSMLEAMSAAGWAGLAYCLMITPSPGHGLACPRSSLPYAARLLHGY
jgi:ABC-2 type transport system permease protein